MRSIRIQVRKGKVEFQGSPPHSLRAGELRLHILLKPMTDTIPAASRGHSHLFGDSAARAAGICGSSQEILMACKRSVVAGKDNHPVLIFSARCVSQKRGAADAVLSALCVAEIRATK